MKAELANGIVTVRPAGERGRADFGWLDSRHTFSFGEYHDPRHMGFRTLRVINEDRVAAGGGFPTHPHRDMEILSYVVEGALEHRDSMGNGSVIRPGDVQRMSAGTGVTHSEFNASKETATHFLQIWIVPERRGIAPGYEQAAFSIERKAGRLCLVASRDGRDGSLTIHQDADVYACDLATGARVRHQSGEGRGQWIQVIRGSVEMAGTRLAAGDGASVENAASIEVCARDDAEFLLFDLGQGG